MRFFRIFGLVLLSFTAGAWQEDDGELAIYRSLDQLSEVLTTVRSHSPNPVPSETLMEGAIDGLLSQLDPHSNFYNKDRYLTMKEDQHGAFFGIGIMVGFQNDRLTVISPVEGTPAFEAGMRAGDVIAAIDGTKTDDLPVYDAIRLLRGQEGSEVVVTALRRGVEGPLVFTLKRAEIPTSNVRAHFLLDDGKTGYVALKDFGETAARELGDILNELAGQNMKQLILDLRGNPGGLLPQAIEVASLFLPGEKLVVSTRGRFRNATQSYLSHKTSSAAQVPMIVLIDRGSASASEIVAGAIQDHDRGLIVGVNSWGKGLVQSVFPLSNGTKGLALTTSRYYTPAGRNIQGSYDSFVEYYRPDSSEKIYFSKRENVPVVKTTHGREIMEVRGITPDVYIGFPNTPELIRTLDDEHAAFFNFAAEAQDRFGVISPDWEADGRVIAAFKDYLVAKDIPHQDFDTNYEEIRRKLTYEFIYISSDVHSSEWAWRYRMKSDDHIHAALALFQRAGELFAVYNGEAELSPNYTTDLIHFAELRHNHALESDAKIASKAPEKAN